MLLKIKPLEMDPLNFGCNLNHAYQSQLAISDLKLKEGEKTLTTNFKWKGNWLNKKNMNSLKTETADIFVIHFETCFPHISISEW